MPLSLLYKIIHFRPAKQQGGGPWGVKWAIFPENHWTNHPNLEPFNLVIAQLAQYAAGVVMPFPYDLAAAGSVIPAPLPGKVYGERFVLCPVVGGVVSNPVEYYIPMSPAPEQSAAWQLSVLMSEREEVFLSDPASYPPFHY